MKKKILITLAVLLAVLIVALFTIGIIFYVVPPKLKTDATIGVKWMKTYSDELTDKYLNFASQNGVNEIYYKTATFDETTAEFIAKAKTKNIKVYAYWDDTNWASNISQFNTRYGSYKTYQNSHTDAQFEGIHLNINPTTISNWTYNKREALIKFLKECVFNICDTCHEDNVKVDFEIFSDLDHRDANSNTITSDSDVVTFDGVSKLVCEWIIDRADRVFVQCGFNKSKDIADCAKEEFEYAKAQGKTIFYALETDDISDIAKEGDENEGVSFFKKSKRYLNNEIKNVGKGLKQDYGVQISDIESWYKMKNN